MARQLAARLLGEQAGRGLAAAPATATPATAALAAAPAVCSPAAQVLQRPSNYSSLAVFPAFAAPAPCVTTKLFAAAAARNKQGSGLARVLAAPPAPVPLGWPAAALLLHHAAASAQHGGSLGSTSAPPSAPAAPMPKPATGGGGTGSPRRHMVAWLEEMRQQGYTVEQDAETGRIGVEGHGGSLCLYARKTPSEWRHAAWIMGVAGAFGATHSALGLLPACAVASPLVFIPAYIIARKSVR